jgi:Fe-S-cluster containining protein
VGEVEPKDLLPVLWGIADAVVRARAETVAALGRGVSCRAGCSACCRQLVPISRTEARHVADVVTALEPERRAVILARFAAAKEKLEAAGLLRRLAVLSAPGNPDPPVALAADYFRAGVDCPFLEHGSCSIYADRPLRCREYVVVSPAAWCDDIARLLPGARDPVTVIKLPTEPATGLMSWSGDQSPGEPHHLSLLLALDWVAEAGPAPRAEGHVMLSELLRRTFSKVPESEPSASVPPSLGRG